VSDQFAAAPVAEVAVLGATGFIGDAIVSELRGRDIKVRPVAAPRLEWAPTDVLPTGERSHVVDALARSLDGADIVVNAAGLADPAAPESAALYGANALLPAMVARACARIGSTRFIHLSSISVQGGGDLDETPRTAASSPYARSRALGERLLGHEDSVECVIFRPTSVHGPRRAVTRSLVRLARSPVSCVAGDGSAPTPQVLVEDVATSVVHLALAPSVPPIVIQPPSGMTTGLLLRLLGGREPRHLPETAARVAVRGLRGCSRVSPWARAQANRIELLLFGRRQVPGWLATQGLAPTLRVEAWQRLGADGAHE
jgi:nucleoside-diphosphate-sugar epimerase